MILLPSLVFLFIILVLGTLQWKGGAYIYKIYGKRNMAPKKRLTVGDHVVVIASKKKGVIVRDDRDSQPYKVRYNDGVVSGWLREGQVKAVTKTFNLIKQSARGGRGSVRLAGDLGRADAPDHRPGAG